MMVLHFIAITFQLLIQSTYLLIKLYLLSPITVIGSLKKVHKGYS